MKRKRAGALLLAACMVLSMAACQSGGSGASKEEATAEIAMLNTASKGRIVNLKTSGLTDPIGIDDAAPTFSWQMASDVIGAAQKAYQIIVRDSAGKSVWDSGVVESRDSVNVRYEGEALQPAAQYTWSVAVTDTGDEVLQSEEAVFETGLMSRSFDAWEGAQWIGADELSLDAASVCVYQIAAGVQIQEGNTASMIVGANDFRLNNSNFNIHSMAGENYVRIELDVSGVTADGGAKINVYRVGYAASDSADTPFAVMEDNETLDEVITAANKNEMHQFVMHVASSKISFTIDGTDIQGDITVNDLGDGSSYNTYPNLNSIGFAARAGETAVFTDYRVLNDGKYASGTLFGESAGATYAIFEGMDGVAVDGAAVTVSGGADGMLGYADPTYAAAPMLRREFETAGDVESARLYLTAQGIYNFYINGQEIAPEEWFNPGLSEYDAILGYNTYDVTEYLTDGANAMGAVLGEGWWTGQMTFEATNSNYFGDQPALMAMLVLNYANGSRATVVTDDSWSYYGDGPVRLASFFQGERYDATKEAAVEGYSSAGYDASAWRKAAVIETRPAFRNVALVTRKDVPVHVIRVNEVKEALGATKAGTDSYLYDMGENVAGVPYITIPEDYAKEGETITVRFAEILYPDLPEYAEAGIDGTLMVENYRAAMVTDFYTMKAGENVFAPDLTFHGYRYMEITGLERELPAECVQMQVLSSLDASATYESSNELANQLFMNIVNSTTSNYISVPTDCPQRNERMGWTGDAQIFAKTGSYVADTYNFMSQWMDTVRADCGVTGMSSQFCPAFVQYEPGDDRIPHDGQSFGITWNALVVTVPYNMYLQTGRRSIVEENIDNIYAYVDTLASTPMKYKNEDGERPEEPRLTGETGTLADHLSLANTDSAMLGNVLFYECLKEAAYMADVVGDADKADAYRAKAEDAKAAWNELYIDKKTGKTKNTDGTPQDTQASYATPLRFGIISEKNLEKVLQNYNATIVEPVGEDRDGNTIKPYTITTGFNATGNVLNALSDNGLHDTAYRLFESTEYASWLYPVTQGATSIWERWNSYTVENGFGGNNAMNSFNHYSYGAVGEWMLGYQAGIMADKYYPGYRQFILQPTAGGTFTELEASYDSVYGTIRSAWTAADGGLTSYDAVIPANTAATLYLPTEAKDAARLDGVVYVGAQVHNGIQTQVYQLVSGSYHFEITGGAVTVSAAAAK